MLNLMLVCYVGDTVDESAVVARIFGTTFLNEHMSNRANEIECTRCFAELGLGPQIYCTFKNGICSEYVSGTGHTWEDISPFRDINLGK
jgi:hypothetical protein